MLDLGDHLSRSVPGGGLVVEAPIADQRRIAGPTARPIERILDLALDSGPGLAKLDVEGRDRLFDAFHQSRAAWAWGFRSAVRSSKLTTDGYRPRVILARAQRSSSPVASAPNA